MSIISPIDDDRNISTSILVTLEAEIFSAQTYNDGQSAFGAVNEKMPCLAILEIKTPRMDGMHLFQKLQPTLADAMSDPLGARFVVEFPV